MIPEIELYPSGEFFNPLVPDPDKIHIEDIAHALSMKCRFTGHCGRFISVAEHSVVVSQLVPYHIALAGLIHDAAEAYLPDVASPVKQNEIYAAHRKAEKDLGHIIESKFGFVNPWLTVKQRVKLADCVCVGIEASLVLNNFSTSEHWQWVRDIHEANPEMVEAGKTMYRFLSPDNAEALFLNRWEELTA